MEINKTLGDWAVAVSAPESDSVCAQPVKTKQPKRGSSRSKNVIRVNLGTSPVSVKSHYVDLFVIPLGYGNAELIDVRMNLPTVSESCLLL